MTRERRIATTSEVRKVARGRALRPSADATATCSGPKSLMLTLNAEAAQPLTELLRLILPAGQKGDGGVDRGKKKRF